MSRCATLMLITVLTFSSLFMAGSVFAQSVPAPSTPTFTLKFLGRYMNNNNINNSYIQVTINNQLLPANPDYGKYGIYYSIRFKPHSSQYFGQVGILMPINNSLSPNPTEASITDELQNAIPAQSNSPYTTYVIVTSTNFNPNADDQIDVQVKAIIGHNFTLWVQTYAIDHYYAGIPRYNDTKVLVAVPSITQDSDSNWSETQTVTIPEIQTPSPEPAASPEPALVLSIVALVLSIAAFVAALVLGLVLLYRIKRK